MLTFPRWLLLTLASLTFPVSMYALDYAVAWPFGSKMAVSWFVTATLLTLVFRVAVGRWPWRVNG